MSALKTAGLALVVAVIVAWLLSASTPFRECINESTQKAAEALATEGLSKVLVTGGIYAGCAGDYIRHNGAAVTAVFTAVLAFSTIGLWLATSRLYRAGERQLQTTRQIARLQALQTRASIQEAKRAADVAEGGVKVARDAFVAGNRPWMAFSIDAAPLQVGVQFRARIQYRNVGRAPALNVRVWSRSYALPRGEPEPPPANAFPPDNASLRDGGVILPGAPSHSWMSWGVASGATEADVTAITGGALALWVVGRIEYRDEWDGFHVTTFRGVYRPDVGGFSPVDPGNLAT